MNPSVTYCAEIAEGMLSGVGGEITELAGTTGLCPGALGSMGGLVTLLGGGRYGVAAGDVRRGLVSDVSFTGAAEACFCKKMVFSIWSGSMVFTKWWIF